MTTTKISAWTPACLDLARLLALIEGLAALNDGHITIYRFTTHWKVQLGTPDLDNGDERLTVANLQAFASLPEAIYTLGSAALLPETMPPVDPPG